MEDKYIVYIRKSSDNEDKQILSLDSQRRVLGESIHNYNDLIKLNDVLNESFEESKSAKAPGRPKFNRMCELLESGQAQNIICWQLNRLARNAVDGGRVIWLVQHYGVKIITPSKTYDTNDLMLMYVEFAMSNQFIKDLTKNTARGTNDKLGTGDAPYKAPIGYYNDHAKKQGLRDILVDDKRFILVRQMWDMLLSGNYSAVRILDTATNDWGLRQINGRPIGRSNIYRIFTNLFYTGQFYYTENGTRKVFQGSHKAMITLEEFDRAQRLLGTKGRSRTTKHLFWGARLMRCTCDSSIAVHERFRKICPKCHLKYNGQKNNNCPKCQTPAPERTTYYSYYHCSKKKDATCKQPHISAVDLETQVDVILQSIIIPQEFIDWTMDQIRKANREEISNRGVINENLQISINNITKKLNNLLEKYLSDENKSGEIISDEEYKAQKASLNSDKKHLEEQLRAFNSSGNDWIETAEKAFNFASQASYWFTHGNLEQKRTIVSALGLNLVLNHKKLQYCLPKPFELIQGASTLLNNPDKKFEPVETYATKAKEGLSDPLNPVWYRLGDSNP